MSIPWVDSVASRTIGVVTVAALLATAGLAAAQQASFSVTLEPQSEAGTLSPGDSEQVNVLVRLEGEGFACASNEDLPVNISVSGASAVTGVPDPAEIVLSNTQGIHASGPAGTYNESGETSVTVQASNSASSGTHDVTVTGTFPGGSYGPPDGSCDGEFPSAEGTTSLPVEVQADQTGGGGIDDGDGVDDGTTGGNGSADDGSDDGEDEDGIPIGPWIAPVALIASALALRRQH